MEERNVPYEKIIFVCANVRAEGERISCGNPGRGGVEIRDYLKSEFKRRGHQGKIRVCSSGCMDFCEEGPNVMVFETKSGKSSLYRNVSVEDAGDIAAGAFTSSKDV